MDRLSSKGIGENVSGFQEILWSFEREVISWICEDLP